MTKGIIDAHIHFSNIKTFFGAAEVSRVDYTLGGFLKECGECGVEAAVCMGLAETEAGAFPDNNAETPMTADLEKAIPKNIFVCPGINPRRLSEKNLRALDEALASESNGARAVGLKIYAGYYHFEVFDDIYAPAYELAAKHSLPVAIHTGDTFSERGLLEYSHPLKIDRLAARYPGINFVAAHMGMPWVTDACEVAYKNRNVFLDFSGMLAGDAHEINRSEHSGYLAERVKSGLDYLNDYKKIIFGTDWPIVPMGAYIDFVKKLLPEDTHEDVFRGNALRVFDRIKIE